LFHLPGQLVHIRQNLRDGGVKLFWDFVAYVAQLVECAGERFAFRCVDEIRPKGFAEAVRIFELRDGADQESERAFCQRWDVVYAAIRQNQPAAALVRVLDFLAQYPGDGVAQYHAERLKGEAQAPRLASAGAMK
jgi:adenylate cyclase